MTLKSCNQENEDGSLRYNAASPDEKALVEGAMEYDHKFIERTPEDVTITTNSGERRTFKVLNVIEFTSSRKRMSIIVKTPEGEIKLMSKGADSMVSFNICYIYIVIVIYCIDFGASGFKRGAEEAL